MTVPRISFVVLSYNYARYIGDCIASILGQQGGHDFEAIVVDDASTDDSDAVIRSFSDPRIRYIRHERNLGHAATVTDGLRVARGELVARIDSDDRYRPDFLDSVVPVFDAHPGVGLVYGDAALISCGGEITQAAGDVVHAGRDYKGSEYIELLQSNFICAPTVIARREAWLAALPIPEWLVFHDWYFTLMIARRHQFYFRSKVIADYRVHAANYHVTIQRNRSDEESVMRLLDLLYSQVEADPALERKKQNRRTAIYGAQYAQRAQTYFSAGLDRDARRCFWQAIRRRPEYLLQPAIARQFAATLTSRRAYERLKAVIKRA
ncbi:MAG: glycosyltransferase family 2 protein [Gemmatimonadota bacterium]